MAPFVIIVHMKKEIVIATTNTGKLKEFAHYLEGQFSLLGLKDIGFDQEIIEDGHSFAENALIKARAIAAFSGKAVLADDSGLEVLALEGAPGIYSARYAGPGCTDADNVQKLLTELDSVKDRSARFYCALAFIDESGHESVFGGEVRGRIRNSCAGEQGFGYDPIFEALGQERTFAEMTTAEKKALSHRGEALRKFVAFLG